MHTLDAVLAVGRFLDDFPGPWWVGGGWALDLAADSPQREHEDIEICVFRADQDALHTYCASYRFFTPVNDQWVPLAEGARLELPDFQLRVQRPPAIATAVPGLPAEFEFFLNDVVDGAWIFRPEPEIRLPLARAVRPSSWGVQVAAPEAVLLHKVRHHRPKDDLDFARVRDHLDPEGRLWLKTQIARIRPGDPWLAQLG